MAVICFVVSMLLNITYITVTLKTPKLRNTRNYLTIALSAADTVAVTGICIQYMRGAMADLQYKSSESLGMVYFTFTWQSFILLVITVERYIAVVKPLHYHLWITKRRLKVALCVTGVVSLVFALVTYAVPGRTVHEAIIHAMQEARISPAIVDMYPAHFFYYSYACIAFHASVGIVTCSLYIPVLLSIRSQLRKVAVTDNTHTNNHLQMVKREHKGTLLLAILIVYFFIVGCGHLLLWTAPTFYTIPHGERGHVANLKSFLMLLSFSPPVVNPVLYGFVSQGFRSCCDCSTYIVSKRIPVESDRNGR